MHEPVERVQLRVFEKITSAYLFQIAREKWCVYLYKYPAIFDTWTDVLFSYQGGYYFEIFLSEPLPDNDSSGTAEFEGVGTAVVTKLNPCKLVGVVPGN